MNHPLITRKGKTTVMTIVTDEQGVTQLNISGQRLSKLSLDWRLHFRSLPRDASMFSGTLIRRMVRVVTSIVAERFHIQNVLLTYKPDLVSDAGCEILSTERVVT